MSKNKKKKNKFKKLKDELNIPFLLLGILLIVIGVLPSKEQVEPHQLKEIEVVLSSDIKSIKGTRSDVGYKFWTKNEKSEFTIDRGVSLGENFRAFQKLKENDTLTLSIRNSRYNFQDKSTVIPVYALAQKDYSFFNISDYNSDLEGKNHRISLLMILGGTLLLLNGIGLIGFRNLLIISGFILLILIVMNFLEVGLYAKE